jgi:hypothetical protein
MDPANFNLAWLFVEKISEAETLLLTAGGSLVSSKTIASFVAVAAGPWAATLMRHLARVADCHPGG